MKNGEMQEKIVRKYTFQILKGCEYLHKKNVIHKDIKGICIAFHLLNNLSSPNLFKFVQVSHRGAKVAGERDENKDGARLKNCDYFSPSSE